MVLKKIDSIVGSLLARLWPRPKLRNVPVSPVRRLLFVRPGGIGDAVLSLPVLARLRQAIPGVIVDVLAETRNSGVYDLGSDASRIFCYDRPRDLIATLRNRYDVVIDSEQWHRLSAIVARMVRSPMKIGFGTNVRSRLFTHAVEYHQQNYELDSFFSLLGPLKIEPPAQVSSPFLVVPDAVQVAADIHLEPLSGAPFVVLFPGASIAERCWGGDKFHHLAIRLLAAGYAVVVVGGPEDVAAGEVVINSTTALNLAGKTSLAETAAILRRSQLLVSGDSGVLHIGVGVGAPTVSLFGPGIAEKWAPRGTQHRVLNRRIACSPCTLFGTTPPCPIGAECIRLISVDDVYTASMEILKFERLA